MEQQGVGDERFAAKFEEEDFQVDEQILAGQKRKFKNKPK